MNRKVLIQAIVIVVAFCIDTPAEEGSPGFLQRETLTGNWGGLRDQLDEKGVKFDIEFTEYYQGMFSGTGYDDFDFGSRADTLIYFDTEKLGLWEGGIFNTHLTYRFGDLPAFRGGALWPVSSGSILPVGEEDRLVASSLYLNQRIGDSGRLLFGKINVIDLLARDPFIGGWGNHRFMNLALMAPPSGVLPPVIMGTRFDHQIDPFILSFMIYDPQDRTSDYFPDDLFSNGVNLSLGGTWIGKVFERATSITLTGIYSTEDSIDLSEFLLPPDLRTGTEDGAYNISVGISHLLLESPTTPGKGMGFYSKAAIADGNPNPIEEAFSGGFAGHHIVPTRPNDTFGIGYYKYNFSGELKSALSPLVSFGNEQGIETFYSFAVTRWFHVTTDLQWIDPAIEDNDNAWIGGLRANVKF